MEDVADQGLGEVGDPLAGPRGEIAEVAERPIELPLADRVDPPADVGEERAQLPLAPQFLEPPDLLGEDPLDARDLVEPGGEMVVHGPLDLVDVDQPDAGERARGGLDVAGDAEVDEEEGTSLPSDARPPEPLGRHDGLGRARREEGHLRPPERLREALPREDLGLEGERQVAGVGLDPAHEEERPRPSLAQDEAGGAGDLPGADDEDPAAFEWALRLLDQAHGLRGDALGMAGDLRLGPRASARPDRGAERLLEVRPEGPRLAGEVAGGAHLAEDLELPEHHRLEPGSDAAEVLHRLAVGEGHPVGAEVPRLDVPRGPQELEGTGDERFHGLLSRPGDEVDLHPVARREEGGLGETRGAGELPSRQARERLARRGGRERNPLAQADRRIPVADPETEQRSHGKGDTTTAVRLGRVSVLPRRGVRGSADPRGYRIRRPGLQSGCRYRELPLPAPGPGREEVAP